MASFERLLATKAYEWKRKKIRTKAKKDQYQLQRPSTTQQRPAKKQGGGAKLPQVIGFSVGDVSYPQKERFSKKRVKAYQQVQMKKLIGIGLVAIGMLLLLTRCFGDTRKVKDEEGVTNPQATQIVLAEDEAIGYTTYQTLLEDFISDKAMIEKLMDYSLKSKQEYAHTFAVWALQRFKGQEDKEALKAIKANKVLASMDEYGIYDYAKVLYEQFIYDLEVFPIKDVKQCVYENGWKQNRTYKSERKHYGIDLMPKKPNDQVEIVSVTSGIVENVGWNELGGYRVGIRSDGGAYFYYAHLKASSSTLKKGDYITAGTVVGVMGDTGYGPEGTSGKFPVHLHFGIALQAYNDKEFWINPFGILGFLEDNK